MTKKLSIVACLTCLVLAAALRVRAGDILDRIVATVNGHIILQSDWTAAVRCEAFMAGRPLSQITLQDRKAALDRLIDQELLREQMSASDFPQVADQEVNRRLDEIRKLYPAADTDQAWQATLVRYGLTARTLRDRVALQLDLMRLVDARLRPAVNIDAKSIESYYNQELLPQLRHSGAKEVSLATVSPKIKELLTQQKVNQLLISWLHNLRAGSQIQNLSATPDSGNQIR
jgi:peptidyl-prolyl cis-trans isomerase SurA